MSRDCASIAQAGQSNSAPTQIACRTPHVRRRDTRAIELSVRPPRWL